MILLYLTILNTLGIIYILIIKKSKYYLTFRKESVEKILVGFRLRIWKRVDENSANSNVSFYLKIRNRNKIEKIESARRINNYTKQGKLQALSAIFSWLKTYEEVEEFKNYYRYVEPKLVDSLVSNFTPLEEELKFN